MEPFFINPEILGDGAIEVPQLITPHITIMDQRATFELDRESLELLYKFQSRTILTLGTNKTAPTYRDVALREALTVSPSARVIEDFTDH